MIIAVVDGGDGASRLSLPASIALCALGNPSHALLKGRRLVYVDCDAEQPRAGLILHPRMIRMKAVHLPLPKVNPRTCTLCGRCVEVCQYGAVALVSDHITVLSDLCRGCGACALQCPESAIYEVPSRIGTVERGRVGSILFLRGRTDRESFATIGVLRDMLRMAAEEQPNPLMLLDLPPGRSALTIPALKISQYALVVTESTPAGLQNLKLLCGMARALGTPLGLILCQNGDHDTSVEDYAEEQCIPVYLRVPLDGATVRACAGGVPLITALPQYRMRLLGMLSRTIREAE